MEGNDPHGDHGLRLFSSQTFSRINTRTPTFSNLVILYTYLPMKMKQSVPKRRHIKFRRPGNYPEESIQYSEHSESFESKKNMTR